MVSSFASIDYNSWYCRQILFLAYDIQGGRVGFLPWQKVFLPGQWKKPVKTGNNWQQLAKTVVHKTG